MPQKQDQSPVSEMDPLSWKGLKTERDEDFYACRHVP